MNKKQLIVRVGLCDRLKAEYASITSQELTQRIAKTLLDGIDRNSDRTPEAHRVWEEKHGAGEGVYND